MSNLSFSVIVPVYNARNTLQACINSIIASTYPYWECLLIDDGSTDGSAEICDCLASTDSRIIVIHKPNGGVSSARNVGIKHSQNDLLTFIDSDDMIMPDMFEKIAEVASSDADLFFTDFKIVDSNSEIYFNTYPWTNNKKESLRNYLIHSWPRVAWGAVKRDLVLAKGIEYPENLTIFEDFHFMFRLILFAKEVKHIALPLYIYHVDNTNSITKTLSSERRKQDEQWVYNDIFRILKNTGMYDLYAPSLYWRLLYLKRHFVSDINKIQEFTLIFPDKKRFIISCPLLNAKQKIIMWCVTHHISLIIYVAIIAQKFRRSVERRLKNLLFSRR